MIGPLIDGAIKRRKVVLAVTLIASLFGFFAYMSMPRESNPNIDFPFLTVVVPYPGVSPEDAERLLVRPLETELQTIEGVKEMNAVARQSMAIVNLEFEANFKKDKALAEVRAKVDLARERMDQLREQLNDAISGGNVTPAADVVVENAVEADTEAAEPSTEA